MALLIDIALYGAVFLLAAFALSRIFLRGPSLTAHDTPVPVTFDRLGPSEAANGVTDYLRERMAQRSTLAETRKRFDEMGLNRDFDCTFMPGIAVFDGLSVPGEWTIVEGADLSKRLLYLHGGAFMLGSPTSHRPLISNIAKRTGCVVFAPDYRLMPENKRKDSVLDSRVAYRWLLENGPDGPSATDKISVAGDSAGGNLTLCLVNWLRDAGLRLPEAVVALSPATDGTGSGPSVRENLRSDHMLGPMASKMLKVPHWLLMWIMWVVARAKPCSPVISPLHDNLAGLPPTLIHASTTEILYDDAKRYFNKAVSQGSPVTIQTWAHLCHVWQMFDQILPESAHALDEIADFLHQQGVTKKINSQKSAAE